VTSAGQLFHTHDFSAYLHYAPDKLAEVVDALDDRDLIADSQDEVIDRLVREHTPSIPVLRRDEITTDEREVQLDVRRDPRRGGFGGGPLYVRATEYLFYVPFTGDKECFFARPSTYTLSAIRAEVTETELVIPVLNSDRESNPAAIRNEFDALLAKIETNLSQLRSDASDLPRRLRQIAQARVEQRRGKRLQDTATAVQLGFPRRTPK
jgi:hypothetical protein